MKKLPQHIAIIMDGNGRWAQERGLARIMGHRAGVDATREIVRACADLGVPYLTLYAFSQENWKRPEQEVSLLMSLLDHFLEVEMSMLMKEKVRLIVIGRTEALPESIQKKIRAGVEKTQDHRRLTLIVALNYGSRGEIVDAARSIARDYAAGAIRELDEIDETLISGRLYTAGLPDPDMLIRTSGEIRLSNFLLWQCSYSEFYISKKYWPDFRRDDLAEAVKDFGERERRFGAIRLKGEKA